jgi:hypothetical protein
LNKVMITKSVDLRGLLTGKWPKWRQLYWPLNSPHSYWLGILCLMGGLLVGCVPATLPPQLAHTPGPAFQVLVGAYRGPTFAARYPAHWRAITGEASAAPSVIFAPPANDALILLTDAPITAPPTPSNAAADQRTVQHSLRLASGTLVYALLSAPASRWEEYHPIWLALLNSISTPEIGAR